MSTAPLIYAELLYNLRQISVIAALDTPCDSSTKAELSTNRHQITLYHNSQTATLDLPGQVAPTARLQKPTIGSKELSWRLPVASPAALADIDFAESNEGPWSARNLKEDDEFLCRNCGAVIIRKGTIEVWRDLPSENWAEMMDFWHCHKPSDQEMEDSTSHKDHLDTESLSMIKGYGANSKFTAQAKLGFVDLATFLLSDTDCCGLKFDTSSPQSPHTLSCINCNSHIAITDSQTQGVRLWKWTLKLSGAWLPRLLTELSVTSVVTSLVLSTIMAQCSSRFLLSTNELSTVSTSTNSYYSSTMPTLSVNSFQTNTNLSHGSSSPSLPSPDSTSLSLWVLSPMIRYTTSKQSTCYDSSTIRGIRNGISDVSSWHSPTAGFGTLAIKVFWKSVLEDSEKKLVETPGVEEISLPIDAIRAVHKKLSESSQFLPPSSRKFQDWEVGLMERYEEG